MLFSTTPDTSGELKKAASESLVHSRGTVSSELGAAEFRQSGLCGQTAGERMRLCNVNMNKC